MVPPFRSMLNSFWIHFGVFAEVLERRREKTMTYLDFGVPLGSPGNPAFIKNRYMFQWKTASLLSSIFDCFLVPFWMPFGEPYEKWKSSWRLSASTILSWQGVKKALFFWLPFWTASRTCAGIYFGTPWVDSGSILGLPGDTKSGHFGHRFLFVK